MRNIALGVAGLIALILLSKRKASATPNPVPQTVPGNPEPSLPPPSTGLSMDSPIPSGIVDSWEVGVGVFVRAQNTDYMSAYDAADNLIGGPVPGNAGFIPFIPGTVNPPDHVDLQSPSGSAVLEVPPQATATSIYATPSADAPIDMTNPVFDNNWNPFSGPSGSNPVTGEVTV